MSHKIKDLGFETWLELFKFLKEENLHEGERVQLYWPDDAPVDPNSNDSPYEVIIFVAEVKANAFDELIAALPLEASVTILKDLLHDLTQLAGKKHTQPLLDFLTKIPTRS